MTRANDDVSPRALWERFGRLQYGDLPEAVRTVAGHCVLDWFACVLAGRDEPLARILRDEFADVPGPCTLVGTGRTSSSKVAALVNGATGHALDFDDTSSVMGGHSTVPVLPALLATAEEIGASGADVVAAFVAGTEIECRLGAAIGGEHYAKGWHKTSTMGVFGAAAGVAHLLRLDALQFGHAMGLAASQASGLKANFGTMTKPFHAGHAAERGLLAARLAKRAFTANPDAFSGKQGLVEAAGSGRVSERLAELDGEWLILQTLFKYHAACYLTHAAIESVLALRRRVRAEDIAHVTVTVHPSLLDVCGIPAPRTGLEAKFSLTGTTSLAFLGLDTSDPGTFVDAIVNRAEVQAFIPRVRIETDRALGQMQTRVECVDRAQNSHHAFHDTGIPATDLAAQGEKLERKFRALAEPVLSTRAATLGAALATLADAADVAAERAAWC